MTRSQIVRIVADLLDEIGLLWDPSDSEDLHLFDELGMDSYNAYEMIAMLEMTFDLEILDGDFDDVWTVRGIVDRVAARVGADPH